MLSLGLAFGEKLLNSYVYDLKPSLNKPMTQRKVRTVFPEIDRMLKGKVTEYEEWINMAKDVTYAIPK